MTNDRAEQKLTDAEFRLFTDLLRNRCGLHFDEGTRFLVEKRLVRHIEESDFGSVASYLYQLRNGANAEEEFSNIVDLLTTNETYFFRERSQLTALVQDERRGSLMSLTVALGQMGFAIGGAVAGPLFSGVGYFSNAVLGAVMVLGMGLIVWFRIPEPRT